MKKYLLTFLAVFVVAIIAITNTSAIAADKPADKPTEGSALIQFKERWAFAAKKKFFTVESVKKIEGQMSTVSGVRFYKMRVFILLQSIWGVVTCDRSNPFDKSMDSVHMMRAGEYEKLSPAEKNNFMGRDFGSLTSCSQVKKYGEREVLVLESTLIFEEFESGWKISNADKAFELVLYEQYLVGEEADAEIKRMDGVQGSVARSLTQKGQFLHMKIKRSGVMLREEVLFEGKAVVGDAVMLLGKGDEVDIYEHEYDHSKPEDAYVRVKTKDSKVGWVQYKDVE